MLVTQVGSGWGASDGARMSTVPGRAAGGGMGVRSSGKSVCGWLGAATCPPHKVRLTAVGQQFWAPGTGAVAEGG